MLDTHFVSAPFFHRFVLGVQSAWVPQSLSARSKKSLRREGASRQTTHSILDAQWQHALLQIVSECRVFEEADLFQFLGFVCAAMASSLESEAAFVDRASKIGVEEWIVDRLKAMQLATFGNFAFAVAYSPQSANDTMFKEFVADLLQAEPDASQLATLRRLFFERHARAECHARALVDVRSRVESNADPSATQRHLPTAERVARQSAQEAKLGGLIFTPDTIPSHHVVDMFVEMCETGILVYVKPELCCSRAQETQTMKRDSAISTDASGLLTKAQDPRCEASTELKLRAALQRRSLAMDLAGIAEFTVVEAWVQFLFTHVAREQPHGFNKVTLQQLVECDKQMFTLAAHRTMGCLQRGPADPKPLDEAIQALKTSHEVLQYLTPLPAFRTHESTSAPSNPRPPLFRREGLASGLRGNPSYHVPCRGKGHGLERLL